MRVWPAVDLLDGRCVRLRRGRFDEVTEYDRDPLAVARRFVEDGARALHVVDLDGAREGEPRHVDEILRLRRALEVPMQAGGGLRSAGDVDRYLEAGVDRVILGTAAVRRPDRVARLVERHGPSAVAVGVDVRDGRIVVEGWTEESALARDEMLRRLRELSVETIIYTDTTRDGTLTVPDVEGAREVAERGFRTLVAGGVSRAEDVAALREAGAAGVVIGSALYTGDLALADARRAAADREGEAGAGERP